MAGATVYAIVLTERDLSAETIARLGRAGADKVLLCEGPALGAPPLDATHGPALQAAVERVSPLLVLFPAGGAGVCAGAQPGRPTRRRLRGRRPIWRSADAAGRARPTASDGSFVRFWRAGRDRLSTPRSRRDRAAGRRHPAGRRRGAADRQPGDRRSTSSPAPRRRAGHRLGALRRTPDDDAAIALARVLVVVDPALGRGRGRRAARRPHRPAWRWSTESADAAAVAAASAGDHDRRSATSPPAMATPRARVGAGRDRRRRVAGGRAVDVVWRVPPRNRRRSSDPAARRGAAGAWPLGERVMNVVVCLAHDRRARRPSCSTRADARALAHALALRGAGHTLTALYVASAAEAAARRPALAAARRPRRARRQRRRGRPPTSTPSARCWRSRSGGSAPTSCWRALRARRSAPAERRPRSRATWARATLPSSRRSRPWSTPGRRGRRPRRRAQAPPARGASRPCLATAPGPATLAACARRRRRRARRDHRAHRSRGDRRPPPHRAARPPRDRFARDAKTVTSAAALIAALKRALAPCRRVRTSGSSASSFSRSFSDGSSSTRSSRRSRMHADLAAGRRCRGRASRRGRRWPGRSPAAPRPRRRPPAMRRRSSPSSSSGSSPKPRPATSPSRSANRSASPSSPPTRRTKRRTVPSVQSGV